MQLLTLKEIKAIHQESKICGLYFLLFEGRVVYIGVSTDVVNRVTQHKTDKVFDRVCYLPTPKELMFELEKRYIQQFRPQYNQTHNPERKMKRKFAPVEKKSKFQQIEEWMKQGQEMWKDFDSKQ